MPEPLPILGSDLETAAQVYGGGAYDHLDMGLEVILLKTYVMAFVEFPDP